MKSNKQILFYKKLLSVSVMLLALLWLTVSTPFIFASKQSQAKAAVKFSTGKAKEKGTANDTPVNTTEEKSEDNITTISEYLHSNSFSIKHFTTLSKHNKCHATDIYIAYHPDLISPPPEA